MCAYVFGIFESHPLHNGFHKGGRAAEGRLHRRGMVPPHDIVLSPEHRLCMGTALANHEASIILGFLFHLAL